MAKLLNKEQPIVAGITYPKPVYSRWVCVWSMVKGAGTTGWGFTPSLGQGLWLLGAKVYFSPEQDAANQQINYGLHFGHGKPDSAGDIQAWEPLIPVYSAIGGATYFVQTEKSGSMDWDMGRLFAGKEIRFGTWINGSAMVVLCEMYTF